MKYQNQESRWEEEGHIPSGWGAFDKPSLTSRAIHFIYQKLQYRNTVRPGSGVVAKGSKQPPTI